LTFLIAGVERRHDRGMHFKDEVVLQVSQFKWLVQSANEVGLQYTVVRDEDVDEKDRGSEWCDVCIDFNSEFGRNGDNESNESYCHSCEICSCFYTCDCPDEHTLCKHVHKVHSFNDKVNTNIYFFLSKVKRQKLNP
jgi:hypothetical protein